MKAFPFSLRISIPAILLISGSLLVGLNIQRETSRSFHWAEQDVSQNARFSGSQISGMLEYLYRRGDVEQAEAAVSRMRGDANLTLSVLYDENNQVLLATHYELRDLPIEHTPAADHKLAFAQVRSAMSGQVFLSEDKTRVWAAYPVQLGTVASELRPSRVGVLWLEYDVSAIKHRALTDALQNSVTTTAGLGTFCVLLWFFFEKTLTRRAARLVATSYSLAQGDLAQRAHLSGSDELAKIAIAFNQMADRIQTDTEILKTSEATLHEQNGTLQKALNELQNAQAKLVQQEKMSSLGQLVAGVAHEINNPVSFIHSNVPHAIDYVQELLALINLYQHHYPHPTDDIQAKIESLDLEFLQDDLPKVLTSMKVGTDRIKQIVQSLRTFSRMDEAEYKTVNLHEGLDSTLLILQHRLKAQPDHPEIQVHKHYGTLPPVECYAGQLNQVFMNILANAIDSLSDSTALWKQVQEQGDSDVQVLDSLLKRPLPTILIHTSIVDMQWVKIAIADNGSGMPPAVQARIFDPFFTTKPVGKGTGMGLSISYQIITDKHHGKLECTSIPKGGTEFVIWIPCRQSSNWGNSTLIPLPQSMSYSA